MIRKLLLTLLVSPLLLFVSAIPVAAAAPAPVGIVATSASDACEGIGLTGADCKGTAGGKRISSVVSNIVNILSAVVGIAAVIMIIIGGFKYITSGGDSNNVAGAKNTIIYAIVGLVVVALAQVIVHFVINSVA